jgi:hypothetical protein
MVVVVGNETDTCMQAEASVVLMVWQREKYRKRP